MHYFLNLTAVKSIQTPSFSHDFSYIGRIQKFVIQSLGSQRFNQVFSPEQHTGVLQNLE